mgnify:CR=1 FL=1
MSIRVASNPYCVWYDTGHMRTFKTRMGAERFAISKTPSRIGIMFPGAEWWEECAEVRNGIVTYQERHQIIPCPELNAPVSR